MVEHTDYDIYRILPYDLEISRKLNLNYINASEIDIDEDYKYIVCQEPKTKYHDIFIQFIIRFNINNIICLKNDSEYLDEKI